MVHICHCCYSSEWIMSTNKLRHTRTSEMDRYLCQHVIQILLSMQELLHNGRFEFHSQNHIFWDVTCCCFVSSSQCFEELRCLYQRTGLLDPEDEGNMMILHNVRHYLTNNMYHIPEDVR